MRLSRRVLQLERHKTFAGAASVMDRCTEAVNKTALRLTGRAYRLAAGEAKQEVLAVVEKEFVAHLTKDELSSLIAMMEQVVFGGDVVAIEQAKVKQSWGSPTIRVCARPGN